MHAHLHTLHEGVSLTMARIREKYWIPRLRILTKRVINECLGWKRFQATTLANPPTGNLPKERTEGLVPFESIAVDFAGPIKYVSKNKSEMKAYILLHACGSTRAVCFYLLPDQTTEHLLRSLKRFMARRGRSENLKTPNLMLFGQPIKFLKKNQPMLKIKISENAPNTYGNVRTSYGKDGQPST